MSDKISNLTEDMINEDRKKFPRVFSMTTGERISRTLTWGGGAVFIIFALNKMKVSKIKISNRTKGKAENLKTIFKNIEIIEWGEVPNFDMIINATSIGLKKDENINLDFSSISKGSFFYDVIYNPRETNFLKIGKSLGNITLNGKLMFIYQALAAFNIWHGLEPDVDENVIKLLD